MSLNKLSKKSRQAGQISRLLIILAVIVFLLVIVIYGVIRFASSRRQEAPKREEQTQAPVEEIEVKPVYETQIGDIRFVLLSAENLGNFIPRKTSYEKDLVTTEKFIRIVVGAQNKGKDNIAQFFWDIGNIVDSNGRNFISINDKAYSYLPQPDLCSALLKPEFSPVPCVKYYEVSKVSDKLKVVVKVIQPKKQESLIDLDINSVKL